MTSAQRQTTQNSIDSLVPLRETDGLNDHFVTGKTSVDSIYHALQEADRKDVLVNQPVMFQNREGRENLSSEYWTPDFIEAGVS